MPLQESLEADGEVHLMDYQKEKNQSRDENLTEMGFKVLRFTNTQILKNIDFVKEQILNVLDKTSS